MPPSTLPCQCPLHDGNYSVVVSNDFGSVETDINEFVVENDINKISGLVGW